MDQQGIFNDPSSHLKRTVPLTSGILFQINLRKCVNMSWFDLYPSPHYLVKFRFRIHLLCSWNLNKYFYGRNSRFFPAIKWQNLRFFSMSEWRKSWFFFPRVIDEIYDFFCTKFAIFFPTTNWRNARPIDDIRFFFFDRWTKFVIFFQERLTKFAFLVTVQQSVLQKIVVYRHIISKFF